MTAPRAMQYAAATLAISLAFQPPRGRGTARKPRSARALEQACRALAVDCAHEGAPYPFNQIAGDCADVLETLAARFRVMAAMHQPSIGEPNHE